MPFYVIDYGGGQIATSAKSFDTIEEAETWQDYVFSVNGLTGNLLVQLAWQASPEGQAAQLVTAKEQKLGDLEEAIGKAGAETPGSRARRTRPRGTSSRARADSSGTSTWS